MTDHTTATNLFLLGSAQEFLRSQLQHLVPDSLLHAAWDEFFGVYNGVIRRFILARGLRGADVDDCAQDVWMEVSGRLLTFEHPASRPGLRAWLYTLVRSKTNDLIRRRNRRAAESIDQASEAGREPVGRDDNPSGLFEKQWERALLEAVLEDLCRELPEINRRLVQMRMVEGRAVEEVAATLGLTSEQVWYRQHRLLKKLQTRVALYTGEPIGAVASLPTS